MVSVACTRTDVLYRICQYQLLGGPVGLLVIPAEEPEAVPRRVGGSWSGPSKSTGTCPGKPRIARCRKGRA